MNGHKDLFRLLPGIVCLLVSAPHTLADVADQVEGPHIEDSQLPVVLKRVQAVYPPDLRRKGINGSVTVEFVVDPHGDVVEAHIANESQSAPWQFQYAGVVAIWQWKFRPGIKNGRPVFVRMQQPFVFSIEDD